MPPSRKRIEEAVEIVRCEIGRLEGESTFPHNVFRKNLQEALSSAIDLMQDYLKFEGNGIVPEKYPIVESLIDERIAWMKGWNACRHEVIMGMMGMEKKISEIIKDYAFTKDGKETGKLCGLFYQDLAHAIVQALQGGSDVKG